MGAVEDKVRELMKMLDRAKEEAKSLPDTCHKLPPTKDKNRRPPIVLSEGEKIELEHARDEFIHGKR